MTEATSQLGEGVLATFPALIRHAAQYGDREAIVKDDDRRTFRQLSDDSAAIALGLLRHGAGKGSRIGLWLGNGPDWAVSLLAITRIGAIAVPLSTFARGPELARAIRHADLSGLIMSAEFRGHDYGALLEDALPELADADQPRLVLLAAPFLRWVVVIGDKRPNWARSPEWLRGDPDVDAGLLEAVESEVARDDIALMIYTSGSSAEPKGVLHTQGAVLGKASYFIDMLGHKSGDRSLTNMPWFWVGGLMMFVMPSLLIGGTVYAVEGFEAGVFLQLIETERLTRAMVWPPHLLPSVLEHDDFAQTDRSSLTTGSTPELVMGVLAPANSLGVSSALGMTETLGMYSWGTPDPSEVVTPLHVTEPGYELKVIDEDGTPTPDGGTGVLWIRGPSLTVGLQKVERKANFDADGFFRTGDHVQVSGSRLCFRGRAGDVIKARGANISPLEVEAALLELEGVASAVVFGVPDEADGQRVVATVVPTSGALLDPASLAQELRSVLSSFKIPREFIFIRPDELPLTGSNKVNKPALQRLVEGRIGENQGSQLTRAGHSD